MILCHCLRWNENSLVKLPQSYWGQLTVCHQIPQSIQGQFKSLGIPVTDFSVFLMLEKTLKSPLDCKEIKPVNLKGNQFWIFIGSTDAEAPKLWPPDAKNRLIGKDPDAGKTLKAGKEGDERAQDGWMASSTQWTWVWASSRSWWQTRKPGILQSMRLQRVRHNRVTELNWMLPLTQINLPLA